MKILTKEQSKKKLINLLSIFQNDEFEELDKYLDSKTFKFWGFSFGGHEMPFLFWDYREVKKIYESVISIGGTVREANGDIYNVSKYDYFEKIGAFLKNQGVKEIYGAGNWGLDSEIGCRVISLAPEEIAEVSRKNYFVDFYFFDQDFSWMLAMNHHDNGFLAGSEKLMDSFTLQVPEFRKYQKFEENCPNCG